MRGRRKITFEGLEFKVSTECPHGIPWSLSDLQELLWRERWRHMHLREDRGKRSKAVISNSGDSYF